MPAASPSQAPSAFSIARKPHSGRPPKPLSSVRAEGFDVVRAEQSANGWVALALSQRVDPMGELAHGGYWLLVSSNKGEHWTPTYLGLRDHRPYHAYASSKVPLLEKGRVRVEVEEAPIDDRSVSFPPVGLRADTVREHVVLEATLTDLTQDSDNDGLTDLLEARWLLDPKNKDTDGDGTPDAHDLTPRLPASRELSARAAILNGFFEARNPDDGPQAIMLAPRGGPATPKRSRPEMRVDCLVGTPEELRGLQPHSRVITLTPEEYAGAAQAFGLFFPMKVVLRVSKDGKHAWLEWNESWSGGSYRADQQPDGSWKFTLLRQWVS